MIFIGNSVQFDGSNDYLTRGAALSSVSDSKQLTASFWYATGTTSTQRVVWGGDATPEVLLGFGTTIGFIMRNAADAVICNIGSVIAPQINIWHHVLISVDLANSSNRHFYVDGAETLAVTTYTNDTVNFDGPTEWLIGANNTFAQKINGDLGELWVAPGVYIDFSSLANREKFARAGGPVNLGSDGSLPTGTAPAIYLSGATSTWHTNLGTGGGFTENGALADGFLPMPMRKVHVR